MTLNENIVKSLSEKFGNAFYLLDSLQFERNYKELTEAFSSIYPNFCIAYSYKTNYTPRLCKIINEMGGYAEVVSDMELDIALRVGVKPDRIIWNGPIKNIDRVSQLLIAGGTVNVDSIKELNDIENIARNYSNYLINLGLRCNFDVGDGVCSRFGFDTDSDEFEDFITFIKNTPNVHLINLQCHFANRDLKYWPNRAAGMIKLVDRVSNSIGYMPERIDIGGGLYGKMASSLKEQFNVNIPSYKDYAIAAAEPFARHFPGYKPELLIEPGSALVGDCMKFMCRVESIKTVRNKTYITILGSQKNINMSGVNPPIQIIHSGKDKKYYENADLVGYTCIEGDVLYHGFSGELAIGDYLVFSNCGSYSLVMKPPFILPNFPVIDISGEIPELIKRAETFEDLFQTFIFDN